MIPTRLISLRPVGCALSVAAALLASFPTGRLAQAAEATPATITVQTDKLGAEVSPLMWGIFFEDINYNGDGGLYPERVKNRSFEFTEPLMGWQPIAKGGTVGTLSVLDRDSLNANNPHYLRLAVENAGDGFGVANEGFFGMGVEKGARFTFSVQARVPQGGPATLAVELVSPSGQRLAGDELRVAGGEWTRYAKTIRANATEPKAHLSLYLVGSGAVDLDMISLFPENTWKHRANGLRPDLVQLLADLEPGFMRFPGGCIVEGRDLSKRYQWKTTIGPLAERKLIINRWNDEFKHRPAPDYFQSFGLGFFEYFQLCEDIGAEPLPILNCGMACQFNTGELAPLDQLDPFIQDALDLIEFANGPAASAWGARRAAMGHPQPFNMKLLGVGNEQWGPQYLERYTAFANVLKAKHPEIRLVSSAGPSPADERFNFLWPKLRELKADIVDEHCYDRPAWFLDNAFRYDAYPRTGPKVFMGEYAAQSDKTVSVLNRNNLECALAEAAYMTGLERNADVVTMSSYAPLMAQEEGWQWRPNLIWFDNLRSYGTPSYYVQQLFSRNRGDVVLPVQVSHAPKAENGQPRFYASATRDQKAEEVILKIVNATEQAVEAEIDLAGTRKVKSRAQATVLTSSQLTDENSLAEPRKVSPVSVRLKVSGPVFRHPFPARSLTVLRVATSE